LHFIVVDGRQSASVVQAIVQNPLPSPVGEQSWLVQSFAFGVQAAPFGFVPDKRSFAPGCGAHAALGIVVGLVSTGPGIVEPIVPVIEVVPPGVLGAVGDTGPAHAPSSWIAAPVAQEYCSPSMQVVSPQLIFRSTPLIAMSHEQFGSTLPACAPPLPPAPGPAPPALDDGVPLQAALKKTNVERTRGTNAEKRNMD
jgi:hypothetical protein